jgi:two-component sensor histidine kinase
MLEKYIIIYILVTLLFSYLLSFYLQRRFPTKEIKQIQEHLEERSWLYKFLSKASEYKNNRISSTLFLFFFNIAMPLIGYIFTLWIVWYLVNVKYEKKVVFTNILDLDEFKNTFMKIERIFGEGSMLNLINNPYTPQPKKLRALAVLASTPSPASLAIIKQTLASKDDEIRLYGYSILNNLEKKINARINNNLEIIQQEAFSHNEKDQEKVAEAAVNLAFAYWELVYMELSHESLKNNFLNSSITYINLAKEFYIEQIDILAENMKNEGDPSVQLGMIKSNNKQIEEYYHKASSLYTLMGRIFLYQGKYEQAQAEFTIAKELLPGNSTTSIPYLAEVYFNIHKYSITKSILNQYDSLRFNAKLYPIIKQWEQKSA